MLDKNERFCMKHVRMRILKTLNPTQSRMHFFCCVIGDTAASVTALLVLGLEKSETPSSSPLFVLHVLGAKPSAPPDSSQRSFVSVPIFSRFRLFKSRKKQEMYEIVWSRQQHCWLQKVFVGIQHGHTQATRHKNSSMFNNSRMDCGLRLNQRRGS
jgi:hypothetical protein